MGTIYKIENNINHKIYIGQTTRTAEARFRQHKNDSKNEKKNSTPLYRAFNKYGIENFTLTILEENVPKKELDKKEIFYIHKYKSCVEDGNGYNITSGGNNARTHFSVSKSQLKNIINELKGSKTTIKSIAEKYNLSKSVVQSINDGRSYRDDNIIYPIRTGINNSQLILTSEEQYLDFIQDLEQCILSKTKIAEKWNMCIHTVDRINRGLSTVYNKRYCKINENLCFPIRIGVKVSQNTYKNIIKDACNNIPTQNLVQKYNLAKRTINAILSGEYYPSQYLLYPIRKNSDENLIRLKKHNKILFENFSRYK